MALVTFVDDNPPYLNAQNLNNNFQPHAITIGLSTEFVQDGTAGSRIIPLDTQICKVGTKLSFDSANHCIVVGSGVDYIEISGAVMQTLNAANLCGFNICKNETTLVGSVAVNFNYIATTGQMIHQSSAPVIVSVSEGDKLYLVGYKNSASPTITYTPYTGKTNYLTARVIS